MLCKWASTVYQVQEFGLNLEGTGSFTCVSGCNELFAYAMVELITRPVSIDCNELSAYAIVELISQPVSIGCIRLSIGW